MNESKIIKIWTIITKIFLVGLLIQFFVQTFITYRLHGTGIFRDVVRMWKELVVIGIAWFLVRFLTKRKIREARRKTTPIKQFILRFGITLLVMVFVSIIINQSWVSMTIMSLRYSMTGFAIFIVFFAFAYLFFWTREINIVKRYARVIKILLVASIFWRGIIWLMPNALWHLGYNQFNYEWDIGIAPPAVYYTQCTQSIFVWKTYQPRRLFDCLLAIIFPFGYEKKASAWASAARWIIWLSDVVYIF